MNFLRNYSGDRHFRFKRRVGFRNSGSIYINKCRSPYLLNRYFFAIKTVADKVRLNRSIPAFRTRRRRMAGLLIKWPKNPLILPILF
jgi:hypothetical protein